jgi:hypothetical protein
MFRRLGDAPETGADKQQWPRGAAASRENKVPGQRDDVN